MLLFNNNVNDVKMAMRISSKGSHGGGSIGFLCLRTQKGMADRECFLHSHAF